MNEHPKLSIVVPVKDEIDRLPEAVEALTGYLDEHPWSELVVAVDAGTRDATGAIARGFAAADPRIRVVEGARSGKGSTLRAGLEAGWGARLLTADVDLAVSPSQFDRLVDAAEDGVVAVASRSVEGAQRLGEPLGRYVLGRVFNTAVRGLVLPGIRDSQCGFKALTRADAITLIREVTTGGWVFDVELLALARRNGMRVREVPVTWRYGHGSSMRLLRDAPRIAGDLWGVRRRHGRRGERSQEGIDPSPPAC